MPRFLRGRTMTNAWREPRDAVGLEDAAIAGRLAREAANPFGRKLAARDLLARFGGDTPEGRRRAQAALDLAGVAAEPPLATAEPHQLIALRAAAPTAAQAAEAGPDAPVVAVVPPRRRLAVGALGLLGLAVVLIAAMLLRGGTGDERGDAFAQSTTTATTTQTAPAATSTAPARRTPAATRPAPTRPRREEARAAPPDTGTTPAAPAARRPAARTPPAAAPAARRVRLRITPTEPSYVCVAEDDGTTIVDTILYRPLTVTRARVRFRIGVGTAEITANGRRIPVDVAPSGFLVTPRATSLLSPNDPVCT